jgi:hypothetical protein
MNALNLLNVDTLLPAAKEQGLSRTSFPIAMLNFL